MIIPGFRNERRDRQGRVSFTLPGLDILEDKFIRLVSTPASGTDEESMASSLLSERSDEDSSSSSNESSLDDFDCFFESELQANWNRLERDFAERNILLHKMSHGLSQWHRDALIRNELRVRSAERLKLLLDYLREDGKYDAGDSLLKNTLPARPTCNSWWTTLWDSIHFEARSTLPAVGSLLLFNAAYCSVFDLISGLTNQLFRYLQVQEDSREVATIRVGVFLMGIIMLRIGGDLFWWLNSHDYDKTKFDLHNRAKLGRWDTHIMRFVRRHEVFRAIMYVIGYSLCYDSAYNLQQSLVHYLFDESDSLLSRLPSRDRGYLFSIHEEHFVGEWANSAEGYLCRFDSSVIFEDEAYTRSILSYESFSAFWESSFDLFRGSEVERNLLSASTFSLCNLAIMVIALSGLVQYGFSWWLKY